MLSAPPPYDISLGSEQKNASESTRCDLQYRMPLIARPFCRIYSCNTVWSNVYIAHWLGSNPTPTPTLSLALWRARGRQGRSRGSPSCLVALPHHRDGRRTSLDQSDRGVARVVLHGSVAVRSSPNIRGKTLPCFRFLIL